jgi:hypothetical protein
MYVWLCVCGCVCVGLWGRSVTCYQLWGVVGVVGWCVLGMAVVVEPGPGACSGADGRCPWHDVGWSCPGVVCKRGAVCLVFGAWWVGV